jgi:dihydroorotase
MTLLLKNGNVVNGIDGEQNGVCDILIQDGNITKLADNINDPIAEVIDCSGLTIMPGIFDMHVHLRDPGQTHKEDLVSGTNAAAAGGVTGMMCMPNTTPAIDTPELVRDIIERAETLKTKVYPCAAITKGLAGKELTDFAALKAAGAVAVSDDGMPVMNSGLMMKAMLLAAENRLTIVSHCEDLDIMRECGDSQLSETSAVLRDIILANYAGVPVHLTHVSLSDALGFVTNNGVVTCDVTPHHFTLGDTELKKRDADYKMNPPLRDYERDVDKIIREIVKDDSCVSCIASDHAPHTPDEKSDFDTAPNGVLGLETLLAVTLTRLYHELNAPVEKIVRLLCINPRRILRIEGGVIKKGAIADLAIVDLNEEWVVDPNKLHSKSKNTCFKEMTLKGKVKYTIVDGNIVFKD